MADDRTINEVLVRVASGTAGFNDAQALRWHIQKLGRERDALRSRNEQLRALLRPHLRFEDALRASEEEADDG